MIIVKVECVKIIHQVKNQPFSEQLFKGGDWLCEFCFIQELVAMLNTAKCQTPFQECPYREVSDQYLDLSDIYKFRRWVSYMLVNVKIVI